MYADKVMKMFSNLKFSKEMKDPDGIGKVGNLMCGDTLQFYIKVKDNKIIDISYKTFGCEAAMTASEALCILAKGKTIEEAEKITDKDIINYLGELPRIKVHCSVLGMQGLHAAIKDYKAKRLNK